MLSALNQSIRNTVTYADVFDFALTEDELHRFLITPKPVSLRTIHTSLRGAGVVQVNAYVVLRGRANLVKLREKHARFLSAKMRSARTATKLLGWLPTISAIFVTGSLAAHNATKNDDIDFFIVTKPGWLWTTRMIVGLVSTVMGKYRTRSTSDVSNMWCFNMWLDETRLLVPPSARSLYTAHEVVQALPLLDKSHIHQGFLSENTWVTAYLGNTQIPRGRKKVKARSMNIIEKIFFRLQRGYMRSALTTEKVGERFAFFHPRNTGEIILHAFAKRGGRL